MGKDKRKSLSNDDKELKEKKDSTKKKESKEKTDRTHSEALTWEEMISNTSIIAQPMATKKLCKKITRFLPIAQKHKKIEKGLSAVQKSIRKGNKGFVVIAGNVDPIDVIIHIPGVCEQNDIPYCYVPSKQMIGEAVGKFASIIVVQVHSHEEYEEEYKELFKAIKALPIPLHLKPTTTPGEI